MSYPFLVAKRLYLRPLTEADADGPYPGWLNDERVCEGNAHHVFPYSREGALAYIRHAQSTRDELILAIVLKDGDRHIGNIALQRLHPQFRSAEFAILIGDRSTWGKGYSKEAAALLCAHGFYTLNLHRIACGTFASNVAMRRLAEYLGMREEGVRRQAAFKDNAYVDLVEYGVLRSEFVEKFAHRPGREED